MLPPHPPKPDRLIDKGRDGKRGHSHEEQGDPHRPMVGRARLLPAFAATTTHQPDEEQKNCYRKENQERYHAS
jgi:hypothetical protein